MMNLFFEKTKLSAYFLWECTKCDNALNHWYCVEDISCFLELSNILTVQDIESIKRKEKEDILYIEFVRHIAFRIYIYTNEYDELANWFITEKLLNNSEWCDAICEMAKIFRREKDKTSFITRIRCEKVRSYYNNNSSKYFN